MASVTHQNQRGIACACVMTLLLSASSAAAGAGRYTALFDEYVDDRKQQTSSAELVVVKTLLEAGIHFVDEAQSRKIRSVTDAGQLMGGTISPVITALDADVIVAGICRIDVIKSDLLGNHAYRYDAAIEAKAISVATGQVLGAYQSRGQAMAFVAAQAARNAAGAAAKDLARQLLAAASKAAGPSRVELTVTGITDLRAGERVRQAVEGVDGVDKLSSKQVIASH